MPKGTKRYSTTTNTSPESVRWLEEQSRDLHIQKSSLIRLLLALAHKQGILNNFEPPDEQRIAAVAINVDSELLQKVGDEDRLRDAVRYVLTEAAQGRLFRFPVATRAA